MMGIFGFGGQSKSELKDIIVENEKLITKLRDEKIEAQISESRAQSGFNAQKEADRANNEVTFAHLDGEITKLKADFDKKVSAEIESKLVSMRKQFSSDVSENKRQVRQEFGTELDTLKKSVASLTVESSKNKGLYDGALIVIKTLQEQLKDVNNINTTLVKALPQVNANITTPVNSVVVGSGNKS